MGHYEDAGLTAMNNMMNRFMQMKMLTEQRQYQQEKLEREDARFKHQVRMDNELLPARKAYYQNVGRRSTNISLFSGDEPGYGQDAMAARLKAQNVNPTAIAEAISTIPSHYTPNQAYEWHRIQDLAEGVIGKNFPSKDFFEEIRGRSPWGLTDYPTTGKSIQEFRKQTGYDALPDHLKEVHRDVYRSIHSRAKSDAEYANRLGINPSEIDIDFDSPGYQGAWGDTKTFGGGSVFTEEDKRHRLDDPVFQRERIAKGRKSYLRSQGQARVRNPGGEIGYIPVEDIEEAMQEGYEILD